MNVPWTFIGLKTALTGLTAVLSAALTQVLTVSLIIPAMAGTGVVAKYIDGGRFLTAAVII